MLQRQHNETPHIRMVIHIHLFFPTAQCLWMEKKFQQLMPILVIRVSLRPSFHMLMMPKTWFACQGSNCEDNLSGIDGAIGRAEDVAERKRIVAASSEFCLFDNIACDFLSCDKHFIRSVTIRFSLRRSANDFVITSEHRDKHYRVEITEANLYVIEMIVTDFVLSSMEKNSFENTRSIQLYWSFTKNFYGHNWCAKLVTRRRFCQRASSSNDFDNEL